MTSGLHMSPCPGSIFSDPAGEIEATVRRCMREGRCAEPDR